MTTNADLLERRRRAVPRGVGNACSVFPERARNAELWDVEGRRYIDFAGGIAVLNTGHLHPRVTAAAAAQMERYSHPCFQVLPYEPYVQLAERLNALAPGSGPRKTIFLTTGAEAVENAVKIARAHTRRPGVITFGGGFHGRTLLTLAMTGKVSPYKVGFGPFPGDVFHAPFPAAYRGITADDSLQALQNIFRSDIEPERVAAIVIEPVLGEGGFYVASPPFMKALRSVCDEHGILLVADEIQSGMGRTGKLFAIEHTEVVPDLITVAKSLAGGLPLSGVIGAEAIMDAPSPGGLGGTYGGNPVACAAALAVLDVMEEEDLLGRARDLGGRITERLREMAARPEFRVIGDVRGLGAMNAFELVADRESREPAPQLTAHLRKEAQDRGLILLSCGTHGNVVRILVPLTASDAVVDEGLDIIEASLKAAVEAS
jgi:4-aminobutyrate aminotransferase/(S)-3-amino-2-methylpropionate transaminase